MGKAAIRLLSAVVMAVLLVPSAAPAQTAITSEGYSATAMVAEASLQRQLTSLRQKNPDATPEEARLILAQRTARMAATRNAVEYLYGIRFEYSDGSFERTMRTGSEGVVRMGQCTYRTLESGLVVATLELLATEEERAGREGLKEYDVVGVCEDEDVVNVVMAMRQAQMDAVEKAVRQAIEERDRAGLRRGRTFTGIVYIIRTVRDEPGIPYRLTMKLRVRLD